MSRMLEMVCDEIERIESTGITTANLDRLAKLVDIKDKLMDYEYKETKKYMMDTTGEYTRDFPSQGISEYELNPMHDEYMEAKKNYRYNHSVECKRELLDKLEKYMDQFADDIQNMMRDSECQEERATIQRYLNKIRDYK